MNKFIFKTIRAGFVFAVALFVVTSTAFASVTIIPSGASDITNTSATLNSQIVNPGKSTYAWIEWSDSSSLNGSQVVAKQTFWASGSIDASIEGLTPGTTYWYRTVVIARALGSSGEMESPVYSGVSSFKTTSPKVSTVTTTVVTKNTVVNETQTNNTTNTTRNINNTNNTSNTSAKKTVATQSTVATKDGFDNNAPTKEGFNNDNNNSSASIVGAGVGILPTTLTGWIILIIALIIILLIVRMIYEESEKRKKARIIKKNDTVVDAAVEKAKA